MEQEESGPQIETSPYASPMHAYGSSILSLTNPKEELRRMELSFRCVKELSDGTYESIGDPLMNEYGINSVIGIIQSIVNQVTVMSSLSKNEIPLLIDYLADVLAPDLMINRVPYGIKSFASRDKIFFMSLTTSFITMKRAYEEGISDKKFWRGSVQEITSRVENSAKRGGMFSSLNPWKSSNQQT